MSSHAVSDGNETSPPNKTAVDGGFGWLIVVAYGGANLMIVPVLTSFGLIFKDKFEAINMSATDSSLILNLNSALGMTLGLVNGVLLKKFGFRKIAFLGGSLFSAGLIATSFANSFAHFLVTYSIITSIGMGLCSSSFSLALNTYFKEKRNRAAGIGMTIAGLGPIFLPQLVSFLLDTYGTQGCVLVIGGISMHIVAFSLLLQPVKRHLPYPTNSGSNLKNKKLLKILLKVDQKMNYSKPSISSNSCTPQKKNNSLEMLTEDEEDYLDTCPIFHDIDTQSIYGFDVSSQPIRKSEEFLWQDLNYKFETKIQKSQSANTLRLRSRTNSILSEHDIHKHTIHTQVPPEKPKRWFESGSIDTINLGSSIKIFEEKPIKAHVRIINDNERPAIPFLGRRGSAIVMNLLHRRSTLVPLDKNELGDNCSKQVLEPLEEIEPETPRHVKCMQCMRDGWTRFVRVFDLGLLNDPIYLNLMAGLSIAVFAEINFSLLTPFILNELNFNTRQIAFFMSTLALMDICCRFISPFIGDFFHQPPRLMYMYSLIMLIVGRSCLLFVNNYKNILIVALGLGIAKGVRSVYMSLVIPNYIPLERLAAASGIQMVSNGVILLTFGSLVGFFRDIFGSYSICIVFINLLTLTTLILWTIEMIYMQRKNAEKNRKLKEQQDIPELCKLDICVE